jgi:ketosteroid isomerase-like protein
MEKFVTVLADDFVQDMPNAPEGLPKRIENRAELIKHYGSWLAISGKTSFTKELLFYPTLDPQTVIVEFRGLADINMTGYQYDQRFIGIFHVENGKITLFREYYNPTLLEKAIA